MNRTVLLVGLVAASVAFAEGAVIKVFEAPAYERADKSSPVVHTFLEGAQVSVSEVSESGFRKVRLPDGKVGYLEESALKLATTSAGSTSAIAPRAEKSPPSDAPVADPREKRSSVFVKDLNHLAELVKGDPVVEPMARQLASRETNSQIAMYGGLAAGTVLAAVGLFVVPKDGCSFGVGGDQFCTYGTTNFVVIGAGGVLMLAGVIAGTAMKPTRGDLLDVLNAWNGRHPEEPFEISGK